MYGSNNLAQIYYHMESLIYLAIVGDKKDISRQIGPPG